MGGVRSIAAGTQNPSAQASIRNWKSCAQRSITVRRERKQRRNGKGHDTFCDTPKNHNLGKSLKIMVIVENKRLHPSNRPEAFHQRAWSRCPRSRPRCNKSASRCYSRLEDIAHGGLVLERVSRSCNSQFLSNLRSVSSRMFRRFVPSLLPGSIRSDGGASDVDHDRSLVDCRLAERTQLCF